MKFALTLALVSLPLAAVAQSPSPVPSATATSQSVERRPIPTVTIQSVDTGHDMPSPSPAPAPISLAECSFTVTAAGATHKFAITGFTVKPSLASAGSGEVDVSAPRAVYSDIEALETQHTIFTRAVFACPSRIATTVANADVATVSERAATIEATFGFTVDYRPDAKNPQPHPTR